jgi:hypothetical protein
MIRYGIWVDLGCPGWGVGRAETIKFIGFAEILVAMREPPSSQRAEAVCQLLLRRNIPCVFVWQSGALGPGRSGYIFTRLIMLVTYRARCAASTGGECLPTDVG